MRGFLLAAIGVVLVSSTAIADGLSLAGSHWQCTRTSDRSQFVITFYPGGGVGGGEFENGEVSPYIFDASQTKPGEWPGNWEQMGQRFTWTFPDQSIRIEGSLSGPGQATARLTGTRDIVGRALRDHLQFPVQTAEDRGRVGDPQEQPFHRPGSGRRRAESASGHLAAGARRSIGVMAAVSSN